MITDGHGLRYAELTSKIIGVFYDRERLLTVFFRGSVVGKVRADLIINEAVLVEVKAGSKPHPIHEAQVLNYLRSTVLEVGLLFNFGARPQFRRLLLDSSHEVSPLVTPLIHGNRAEHCGIGVHPCSSVASAKTKSSLAHYAAKS